MDFLPSEEEIIRDLKREKEQRQLEEDIKNNPGFAKVYRELSREYRYNPHKFESIVREPQAEKEKKANSPHTSRMGKVWEGIKRVWSNLVELPIDSDSGNRGTVSQTSSSHNCYSCGVFQLYNGREAESDCNRCSYRWALWMDMSDDFARAKKLSSEPKIQAPPRSSDHSHIGLLEYSIEISKAKRTVALANGEHFKAYNLGLSIDYNSFIVNEIKMGETAYDAHKKYLRKAWEH